MPDAGRPSGERRDTAGRLELAEGVAPTSVSLCSMPRAQLLGTNLLTQCQVPVPVFSMFLTPFRGYFETESKRKKIPEKIFSVTEEDREAWEPRQGSLSGPTSPRPAARGVVCGPQDCGPPGRPPT